MSEIASILRQDVLPATSLPTDAPNKPRTDAAMRQAAKEFEAVFLTEMLKHAGLGKMPEVMNGGVGEAAFSDFLAREYAMEVAGTRSIGIAERVYQTLKSEGMR